MTTPDETGLTPPARRSGLVRGLSIAAVVLLVLGAASLRAVLAGEEELAASTEALRAGDAREAAVRARRAAAWYVPGAPHVRVAYERLIALAVAAEGLGDRDLALFAWRAVRTAAIETRWVVTPHAADLARANESIARIAATAPRPPGTRTEPAAKIEREQLAALTREEGPRAPWAAALVLGFAAWAVGSLLIARRAVSATGHVAWRRALPGLAIAAIGAAMWL